ncbi:transposase [Salipiger bermudensis HTCC2601]|uniref:Transposase n=1 Tax=Salipiger bermudensis (strain DSM 26914 / JCM 13377 / KCTC 12554 / HTCC2601) TaxID=314265 RepID=Q0FQD9_SALBH|nr:transposase [Salipiger bermudensis HTCC2601]
MPTVARLWPEFCTRADKEGWPAERLLAALCELELSEREQRRIQRHLAAARLPQGKTLDAFDFLAVPTLSQARVRALVEGDSWLQAGHNLLAFRPARLGQDAPRGGHRIRTHPTRVPCAYGKDVGPGPTPASGAAGPGAHSGDREARQVRPAHPRRPVVRAKGSGRDQRPLRAHLRTIRAALYHDHGQSAVQWLGRHLPRQGDDHRRHRSARSPCNNLRDERRKLPTPCRLCRRDIAQRHRR